MRPFYQLPLGDIDEWLNLIECRFGPEEDFEFRESAATAVSARNNRPEFKLSAIPQPILDSLEFCELQFVVTFSDEGRKLQRVVYSTSLSEIQMGSEVQCQIPPGQDWTSPQGAILSLLVCSKVKRAREPGIPFRKSSTVGVRHIGINRTAPGDDFPVRFLSDDDFKTLHYHPRTMAIVQITPDDLECERVEDSCIGVLVHKELKGVLSLGSVSKKGRLAEQIVMESVTNQIAFAVLDQDYSPDSLGHRVRTRLVKRISGNALNSSPATLRAATQGSYGLVDSIRKL